ncbi:class I SAM-dependent methyltransferase [Actinomycetospora straminea]|uniref:Methyltransferase type 11 domain-containing protein n=1 Tax=Actinomycetospora straminea TaxID=663607 RepID=A0ABP9E3D4_9PSEU|nr:class I SAM-dependent methyltransferase [Actinomycetospora straminea]MDD7931040.1 class I SAM-dependent methyltransferase [Actinomycetospora straminea]
MRQTKWEQIAETRWGRYLSAREKDAIVTASRLAGPPGDALDIGAEGGRWARLLRDLGWSVTCTDVDEDAVALCAARLPDVRCLKVSPDREELPIGDRAVGLVICIEVIAVVSTAWFAPEVARVLAPGGSCVTVVWNCRSVRGWAANLLERYRHGRPHPYYTDDYASWRQRLVDHDFDIVSERGMAWFPFRRSSDSPAIPWATKLEDVLRLPRLVSWSPWVLVVARRRG